MPKNIKKIIIVGAGPVGCYLGQLLKHYGFDPLLLEEHAEVGKPVQCAGIVGRAVFDGLRLPLSDRSIINTIDGARIFFNSASFTLHRPGVAFIIDREKFDKELSQKLNIEHNTLLHEVQAIKGGYLLKTSNGDYYADIVIGADGPNSKVRKSLNFVSDMRLYRGYQYRIKMAAQKKNQVDVYYVKPFSFFTWVIPESADTVRVGTISNNPYQELNDFVAQHHLAGEVLEKNAGAIPIGTCELVKGAAALVGDAACQIKPITSGGLFYGMRSAEILADALKEGDLELYAKRWAQEFEKEIKVCLLTRYILENMDENVLHRTFDYCKENVAMIERIGDFENHSSVFWSLFSNPRTYPTIGSLAWGLFKKPQLLFRSLWKNLR